MLWWAQKDSKKYDAIVCDGSVRSGKTVSMTVGFVLWSMGNFNGQNFALCGKTIESLIRNVIYPMQTWLEGIVNIKINLSRHNVEIESGNRKNRYYFFGGKDESSYQLIQGITLAGVFFDEVALMPRSFVEQALARCSVHGSKMWFNCNPDSSEHWFYKEWVDDDSEKTAGKNRLHLHFTMEDNYSLSDDIKKRYKTLYTGVFYERYILGLWVLAEGLVYPQWQEKFVLESYSPTGNGLWYISMDYGTVNPCSMGVWYVTDTEAVRVDEYYYNSRETKLRRDDEQHYAELERLAGDRDIQAVIIDPSAASFIECILNHGKFGVRKAKNDVLDGIRRTSTLISSGVIKVCACCTGFLKEIKLYRWDESKHEDTVIKENDHAMDDTRYLVNTVLRYGIMREMGGDAVDK